MINLEKFGHDKLYDTDPKFLGGGDDNHEIRQPRELVSKPGFQKKKKKYRLQKTEPEWR